MSGLKRYDGDTSEGREIAHLGDVCPAENLAEHPWIAELHSITTNVGEKMITAFEKAEDYAVYNPNKTAVGVFGSAYLASALAPGATAAAAPYLPALGFIGIGAGVADIAVVNVTGKMLGCWTPPH
ncbi:MAG TPA: hypothetical protein V6C72_10620 [Chroococcales cyanobacterium]